ncbi:LPS assembly protein LptD [Oleiagrimonas sp. C23AA]|nr:LPS assembly protein LptD [Oleiagrimonas sp. C23AA]
MPGLRPLALAIALAACAGAPPTAQAKKHHAPSDDAAPAGQACPLGTFICPPRPVSYAMCRPNALLSFYQPGLPRDTLGRETALTDVHAVHANASDRQVYHLSGRVRLQRYDQLLRADDVTYNDRTTAYDAKGNVRYQESGLLMSASHMRGTTTPEHGVADDVNYQLLSSRGNGKAKTATLIDKQHSNYHYATYSTCDPDDRVWEFDAKSIVIDKVSGVGKAHSAVMRYKGVPFMYLPYFTFPVDDRRKSGFLFPMIGHSSNAGYMLSLPYYLNLAPNYDATITPQLYSQRGTMASGEFRYLTQGSHGILDFSYLPSDQHAHTDHHGNVRNDLDNGANRYFINYQDYTRLPGRWSFTTHIRHVSDRYFFRDFSNDLVRSSSSVLHSDAYLRGSGQWWSASFGADRYESIDQRLTDSGLQYKRWPRATFNLNIPIDERLQFSMTNEAVAFRKNDAVEGNRLDIYPKLAMPFQGAAWYVRPEVGYRFTGYQLLDGYQKYGYTEKNPTRSVPIVDVDSGLIFERDADLFGHHYTQTLEPRLYYLYVPYRDQSNQPLFDTREMTFDYWQLFTTNRFSGADRQMNANNLTAAVTSRLLDDGGVERASVSFGQIRYFTPQRVQAYGAETDYSGSAYVAQGTLNLTDKWRLTSSYQWDPNNRQTDVGTVGFQRRLGANGIVNFSYRYRDQFMEQFDVSAVYPLSDRWRLLGRWNVSLRDQTTFKRGAPKTIEALAGIEYDSCCVAVQLVGRHYVDDEQGDTNNAIMLQIQFKGLGSFNPQTEDFLRHAILGYQ